MSYKILNYLFQIHNYTISLLFHIKFHKMLI